MNNALTLKKKDRNNLYIVVAQVGEEKRCKIGISEDVSRRLRELQRSNAFSVELYKEYNWKFLKKNVCHEIERTENEEFFEKVIFRGYARAIEDIVKRKYGKKTSHNYSTEWFNVLPEEMERLINKILKITDLIGFSAFIFFRCSWMRTAQGQKYYEMDENCSRLSQTGWSNMGI